MIRVVLADDHPLLREGLRFAMADAGLEVVAEADSFETLVARAATAAADVVLTDFRMPSMPAARAVKDLSALESVPAVLFYSAGIPDRELAEIMLAGASGVISKECGSRDLVRAVRHVHAGGTCLSEEQRRRVRVANQRTAGHASAEVGKLTPREGDLLRLLAEGRSNREMADRLGLTYGTVRVYLTHVFAKLNVQDRTKAALLAAARLEQESRGAEVL